MFSLPPRLEPIVAEARRVSLADPFLISGAIAYNVFFALIPLAFAAVASLSMIASGAGIIDWIQGLVAKGVPSEVGDFVIATINDVQEMVGGLGTAVIVVSLVVALWSGSRAIYAVQKSLRLIEGVPERRAYWKERGLGILLTLGAGVALVGAYVVLLFGGWVMEIFEAIGFGGTPMTLTSGVVIVIWASAVLFAIYRWGISTSIPRPLVSGVAVALLLMLATWLGAVLLPSFGGGTAAALGSVGVVLVWAYVVGFVVIVAPSVVFAIEMIIRGSSR